jgi:hypothetical protein
MIPESGIPLQGFWSSFPTGLADCAACFAACDGSEAIEAFVDALDFGRPFDLICLDVMMPGMSGHAGRGVSGETVTSMQGARCHRR